MLRGRLALVSVYLCLVCLPGLTPQLRFCPQDIIKHVKYFSGKASALMWLDCRLYTPTTEDFQNCPISALTCFAGEIKVLIEEWVTVNVSGIRRSILNKNVEKLAKKLNETIKESECLQCEHLKEKEAQTFLKHLQETLEMINVQYTAICSPKGLSKGTS